jgi:hypothetical protein
LSSEPHLVAHCPAHDLDDLVEGCSKVIELVEGISQTVTAAAALCTPCPAPAPAGEQECEVTVEACCEAVPTSTLAQGNLQCGGRLLCVGLVVVGTVCVCNCHLFQGTTQATTTAGWAEEGKAASSC